ncbi:MAG: hypothetical protein KatS3mg104_1979 [Phycisphaerae bacterium]|jgi:hypothetical protein|nr:MAG: hypothetical protein KatS3mg104_1979 [Phycisphaerae bacterium]
MILLSTTHIILAQQNEEFSIFKLLAPILILLFWLITQILASMAEKKKRIPPSETMENPPISTDSEESVFQPTPPPRRVPQAPRQGRPRPPVRQPKKTIKQPQPPALPNRYKPQSTQPTSADTIEIPPQFSTSSPNLSSLPSIGATEIGASASGTTQSDGPNRLHRLRAILRPANLRKEFILTEILQPPVGLRSDSIR